MVNIFVLAFLCTAQGILLLRRVGASFGDGLYSVVGGKVEPKETALQAIHREVLEETALDIPESSFELVHTLHRKGTETEFIALCFKVNVTNMPQPRNNEPDKHDDMRFFALDQLPENIIPAHHQIINCVQKNIRYSEHGW
jgi:8-oxo-dGTP diphosphatase